MYFKVKTFPGSKNVKVVKKSDDSFDIFVKEKAERGLANRAVVLTLSAYFKVPAGRVRLIRGAKSRKKIFEINL